MIVALALLLACELPPDSVGAHEGRCASCHPAQAAALAAGAMGDATGSPLFQALRDEAGAALGAEAVALCDRCHAPAVGSGVGLSCATCHAAIGNQAPENGLLLFDPWGPVRGPTGVVDPRAPHAVAVGGIANDSALCGTCHDVRGPAGFAETPFAHWAESEAAAEGVGCVDCHMSPVPGEDRALHPEVLGPATSLPGLAARPLADHRFVGLNRDPAEAVALLRRSVALEWVDAADGPALVVHNLNPGHDLPDGASFLRELWVEVERADGSIGEPVWLSTRLSRGGAPVVSPVLADAQLRGAIPAGGSRTVRVDATGPLRACVWFRAIRPDLLEHLALDPALAGPVWEVACAERG